MKVLDTHIGGKYEYFRFYNDYSLTRVNTS